MYACQYEQDIEYNNDSDHGHHVKIPAFKTIFKSSANRFEDHQKIKDWIHEVFECSSMSKDSYDRITGASLLAQWCHPFTTNIEKLEDITKLYMIWFIYEDHSKHDPENTGEREKIWNEFAAIFEILNNPGKYIPKTNWHPYSLMAFAVLESIWQMLNDLQRARFTKYCMGYINGHRNKAEILDRWNACKNIKEYFQVRIGTDVSSCMIQLIEFCTDIFVPEKDWNHRQMKELFDQANLCLMYINDIYSFEKDYRENDSKLKDLINSVAAIVLCDKCSVNKAMIKAVKYMEECERKTMALIWNLLQDDKICEDTKKFINNFNYLIGGFVHSHVQMNKFDTDQN